MKKNETIHERISQLVDYFGDRKNTVFAKLIGESEANVRGYKENVVPKHPFLEKIVRNLDVSPLWLLTGQGPMLLTDDPPSTSGREAVLLEMLSARDNEIKKLNREIGALEERNSGGRTNATTHRFYANDPDAGAGARGTHGDTDPGVIPPIVTPHEHGRRATHK
jgi:hypothetical protein